MARKASSARRAKSNQDWRDMFDFFYALHVCASVREEIIGVAHGCEPGIQVPLRTHLLSWIEEYINTRERWPVKEIQQPWEQVAHVHEAAAGVSVREPAIPDGMGAAWRLHEKVTWLAEAFEDRYPFDESAATVHEQELIELWRDFIVLAAGPLIYALPMQMKRIAKGARLARRQDVTVEGVQSLLERFKNTHQGSESGFLEWAARKLNTSTKTIGTRLKSASKSVR